MRRNLRNREVPYVEGDDGACSAHKRSGKYVLVIRIGQTEGTIMGFPIFDQSVVESGCHLANEVTRPRSCGSGWFSSIDQLLRLVVFEFGQDLG